MAQEQVISKLTPLTILCLTNLETNERLEFDVSGALSQSFVSDIFKLPFVEGELNEDGSKRTFGKRKFGNIGIHIFGSVIPVNTYK